jgi:hypothetical protein
MPELNPQGVAQKTGIKIIRLDFFMQNLTKKDISFKFPQI